MTYRWICILLVGAACRTGTVAERSEMLPELCEDYCPRRVECVADGWASDDVAVCTRLCTGEERYVLDNECGAASFALLECMAALTCEELPGAAVALANGDEAAGCYAEQAEQRERCTFWIEH